jgi:hypothetical protein
MGGTDFITTMGAGVMLIQMEQKLEQLHWFKLAKHTQKKIDIHNMQKLTKN